MCTETDGAQIMATYTERLTRKFIDEIRPPTEGRDYYRAEQDASIILAVTPTGTKTWLVSATVRGATKRLKLAPHGPEMDFKTARELANGILQQVHKGLDPVAERRAEKTRSDGEGVTLQELLDGYLQDKAHLLKPRTRTDYANALKQFCPAWMGRPVVRITPQECEDIYKTKAQSAPYVADRGRRVLGLLFNYHQASFKNSDGLPLLPVNPVQIIREKGLKVRQTRKKSRLTESDIQKWWAGISAHSDKAYGSLLKFLLLTGCRFSEGAELKWKNVRLDDRFFILPDPKNRRMVEIPISTPLHEIFSSLQSDDGEALVFPSSAGTPFTTSGGNYGRIAKKIGVKFSPHDLRRTFSSIASEMDINFFVQKLLMNHIVDGDVTGGYLNISRSRMLAASERIAEEIMRLATLAET